jgi:hypothetical protein
MRSYKQTARNGMQFSIQTIFMRMVKLQEQNPMLSYKWQKIKAKVIPLTGRVGPQCCHQLFNTNPADDKMLRD